MEKIGFFHQPIWTGSVVEVVSGERYMHRRLAELPVQGTEPVPGHGSCSTEYVRGREAVMPQSGLEINLAECEDPRYLRGECN